MRLQADVVAHDVALAGAGVRDHEAVVLALVPLRVGGVPVVRRIVGVKSSSWNVVIRLPSRSGFHSGAREAVDLHRPSLSRASR